MATDFEHKLNCADELYQPVKFEANPLPAYPDITLSFSYSFLQCGYDVILDFFLMGTRLKIMKMAASLWGGNMTLNCDISRTSWHMKVSDGSFVWIFHALSFEPNL